MSPPTAVAHRCDPLPLAKPVEGLASVTPAARRWVGIFEREEGRSLRVLRDPLRAWEQSPGGYQTATAPAPRRCRRSAPPCCQLRSNLTRPRILRQRDKFIGLANLWARGSFFSKVDRFTRYAQQVNFRIVRQAINPGSSSSVPPTLQATTPSRIVRQSHAPAMPSSATRPTVGRSASHALPLALILVVSFPLVVPSESSEGPAGELAWVVHGNAIAGGFLGGGAEVRGVVAVV